MSHQTCPKISSDIAKSLLDQLRRRFCEIELLDFFEILNEKKFSSYHKNFPDKQLSSLINSYPRTFDLERLKNELCIIYSDNSKHLSTYKLISYIVENDLTEVYPQTFRLLSLCLAFPCTTSSSERSMSKLRIIKNYLRNTMEESRLSSLAKISIERKFCNDLMSLDSFREELIDEYAETKDRKIDLKFKKV